jgi:hypothetical protein
MRNVVKSKIECSKSSAKRLASSIFGKLSMVFFTQSFSFSVNTKNANSTSTNKCNAN